MQSILDLYRKNAGVFLILVNKSIFISYSNYLLDNFREIVNRCVVLVSEWSIFTPTFGLQTITQIEYGTLSGTTCIEFSTNSNDSARSFVSNSVA